MWPLSLSWQTETNRLGLWNWAMLTQIAGFVQHSSKRCQPGVVVYFCFFFAGHIPSNLALTMKAPSFCLEQCHTIFMTPSLTLKRVRGILLTISRPLPGPAPPRIFLGRTTYAAHWNFNGVSFRFLYLGEAKANMWNGTFDLKSQGWWFFRGVSDFFQGTWIIPGIGYVVRITSFISPEKAFGRRTTQLGGLPNHAN